MIFLDLLGLFREAVLRIENFILVKTDILGEAFGVASF